MAPILEPLGTPNHKKSRKTGTQKNTKNWIQTVSHFDLKNEVLFRAETAPKSHKSESWAQDVPPSLQKSSNTQKNEKRHSMPSAIWSPKIKKIREKMRHGGGLRAQRTGIYIYICIYIDISLYIYIYIYVYIYTYM